MRYIAGTSLTPEQLDAYLNHPRTIGLKPEHLPNLAFLISTRSVVPKSSSYPLVIPISEIDAANDRQAQVEAKRK